MGRVEIAGKCNPHRTGVVTAFDPDLPDQWFKVTIDGTSNPVDLRKHEFFQFPSKRARIVLRGFRPATPDTTEIEYNGETGEILGRSTDPLFENLLPESLVNENRWVVELEYIPDSEGDRKCIFVNSANVTPAPRGRKDIRNRHAPIRRTRVCGLYQRDLEFMKKSIEMMNGRQK